LKGSLGQSASALTSGSCQEKVERGKLRLYRVL
jgi:hypothetical protein